MSDTPAHDPRTSPAPASPQPPQTIIIQHPPAYRGWMMRLLVAALSISVMFNIANIAGAPGTEGPNESFDSGDRSASAKIAVLEISGTIMPPFTERTLETIEQIRDDDDVKGVLLVVDSPGGLVTDSHQIYHRLQQLSEIKPIYVSMSRMAASGGYYVAMGAGPDARIFAEPTCWTGSIGVIIPRYNVRELAEQYGVQAEPLTTGPYKDALSPFRDLSDDERAVWEEILEEAFAQFKQVIVAGRAGLDDAQVDALATGRVFTSQQSLANGLIDEIGYEEDAIEALQQHLGLSSVRVVRYSYPATMADLLLGAAASRSEANPLALLLEAGVPRAMYMFGWDTVTPQ